MPNSLYRTAVSGVRAQQLALDTTANNLANVNTPGYKRVRNDFHDLLQQRLQAGRVTDPATAGQPTLIGSGTRADTTTRLFNEGSLQESGRALDLAIVGDGFFQVRTAAGQVAFSRDGTLHVDANGRLTNADGDLIEPAVTLPAGLEKLRIDEQGNIFGVLTGSETEATLGQIQLARFINPGGLTPIGANLFIVSANSGEAQTGQPGQSGFGALASGFLEASNVDLSAEMTSMIRAQRAYEVNLKALQTIDELTGQALQLRR